MNAPGQFSAPARILHWLMAAMIVAMLFIGVGMVATVAPRYQTLVAIHRPLGLAVLVVAVVRLLYRWLHPAPSLPVSVPSAQRMAARASHYALYALMLLLPLVGWAMLSAAPYPIVLGSLHLPPLMAPDAYVYSLLRRWHTYLAYVLFATILLHLAAALFHALIRRDGVFDSMAWRMRR